MEENNPVNLLFYKQPHVLHSESISKDGKHVDHRTFSPPVPLNFSNSGNLRVSPKIENLVSTSNMHQCPVCSKAFTEYSLLQRHKTAHAVARHICRTCGRAFVREDKLRRHIRSVHTNERPFVCEVCSKAFARKDKLQEHVRHHNRDITFPCPVCLDVFLMRSSLNRHMRTEHQVKTNSTSRKPLPEQSTIVEATKCDTEVKAVDSRWLYTSPYYRQQNLQAIYCPPKGVSSQPSLASVAGPLNVAASSMPTSGLGEQAFYPSPSAFSAAVAARLLSPVNYNSWWPQTNWAQSISSLQMPLAGDTLSSHACTWPEVGGHHFAHPLVAWPQYSYASRAGDLTADSSAQRSRSALATSWPSLAQAVYYRAASLAALQRGPMGYPIIQAQGLAAPLNHTRPHSTITSVSGSTHVP